ncbi:MAG: hypothetical protein WDO70_10200 [Alphaproteobacteria bacterium]
MTESALDLRRDYLRPEYLRVVPSTPIDRAPGTSTRLIAGDLTIEAENSYDITNRQGDFILWHFVDTLKFPVDATFPCTTYLDDNDLSIFGSHATLRARNGASTQKGVVFPTIFSTKRRIPELQAVSDELTSRIHGNLAHPLTIRRELERAIQVPGYERLREVREEHFPEAIREELRGAMGSENLSRLIATPKTATFSNKPRQFIDTYWNSETGLPEAKPTKEMQESQAYVCLEICIDKKTKFLEALPGADIKALFALQNFDTTGVKYRGKRTTVEFELRHKLSGKNIDDSMVIEAAAGLEIMLRKLLDSRWAPNGREEKELRDKEGRTMPLAISKGAASYGVLPVCRPGGTLYHKYQTALPFAP